MTTSTRKYLTEEERRVADLIELWRRQDKERQHQKDLWDADRLALRLSMDCVGLPKIIWSRVRRHIKGWPPEGRSSVGDWWDS